MGGIIGNLEVRRTSRRSGRCIRRRLQLVDTEQEQASDHEKSPMKIAILAISFFLSNESFACYSAPRAQRASADELVALSSNISLAKVIMATPRDDGSLDFVFLVQKRLFGASLFTFVINGRSDTIAIGDRTFANHFDDQFWRQGGGRLSSDTDCKIHPTFIVGRSYLVLQDPPFTNKSFEQIDIVDGDERSKDKWLEFVMQKLHSQVAR